MAIDWTLLVVKYVVLCKLYFFVGLRSPYSRKPLVTLLTKCGPMLLLIVSVATVAVEKGFLLEFGFSKVQVLLYALVFSLIGDACLVYHNYFIFGLLSFAVTQVLYTVLFGGSVNVLLALDRDALMTALGIAVVSLTVYAKVMRSMDGVIKVAAFVYCTLISVMLWSAIMKVQRETTDSSICGAAGAGLFYTSDLLLALDKWACPLPLAKYAIMITYYSAQLFIFASVLFMA